MFGAIWEADAREKTVVAKEEGGGEKVGVGPQFGASAGRGRGIAVGGGVGVGEGPTEGGLLRQGEGREKRTDYLQPGTRRGEGRGREWGPGGCCVKVKWDVEDGFAPCSRCSHQQWK